MKIKYTLEKMFHKYGKTVTVRQQHKKIEYSLKKKNYKNNFNGIYYTYGLFLYYIYMD